jgi:hypothetical protein
VAAVVLMQRARQLQREQMGAARGVTTRRQQPTVSELNAWSVHRQPRARTQEKRMSDCTWTSGAVASHPAATRDSFRPPDHSTQTHTSKQIHTEHDVSNCTRMRPRGVRREERGKDACISKKVCPPRISQRWSRAALPREGERRARALEPDRLRDFKTMHPPFGLFPAQPLEGNRTAL